MNTAIFCIMLWCSPQFERQNWKMQPDHVQKSWRQEAEDRAATLWDVWCWHKTTLPQAIRKEIQEVRSTHVPSLFQQHSWHVLQHLSVSVRAQPGVIVVQGPIVCSQFINFLFTDGTAWGIWRPWKPCKKGLQQSVPRSRSVLLRHRCADFDLTEWPPQFCLRLSEVVEAVQASSTPRAEARLQSSSWLNVQVDMAIFSGRNF